MKVAIIDYGVGNLLSVHRAIEVIGAEVICTSDENSIVEADRVILPGVGAFGKAMEALNTQDLVKVIRTVVDRGTPFLGICLGMQLIFQESEEFGIHEGLGLLRGRVCAIPKITTKGEILKVPHIGWSELEDISGNPTVENSWFRDVESSPSMYFVHSYRVEPEDESMVKAFCVYGGYQIPAVVRSANIMGCQFHPEKSGKAGLTFLKKFLEK